MCRSESNCSEANKAVGNFWLFWGTICEVGPSLLWGWGEGSILYMVVIICIECQGGDYACEMGDPWDFQCIMSYHLVKGELYLSSRQLCSEIKIDGGKIHLR